ncbi:hypothetical protein H6F67_16670 [Microcoleus sp. FACHB-1515]|uniref:hypothetical protein n=1 Tax=Cyanophyceae TaxID=3028117 RepID=UPI0016839ED1|nr:hypothetical protein [Microcoleus sp. FACHB-1515]MBD2091479.1 hypothetical protein [Microcoleus sp. FACHB-1515]
MASNPNKNFFPLWQFLNQRILDAQAPVILNPRRFWHVYRINHLERCLSCAFRPEERRRS